MRVCLAVRADFQVGQHIADGIIEEWGLKKLLEGASLPAAKCRNLGK
jgi:hypothetical protein